MPQTLEQGDIFGRIGKALGEGTGEQIRSNRVAGALTPKEGQTFDPLQQIQNLTRAGATPQEISQYMPFVTERGILKEAQQNQGITNKKNVSPVDIASGQNVQRLLDTPDAVREGGVRYTQMFPLRYRNIEQGEAQYRKDLQTQKDQISEVNDRFVKVGSELLQKGKPETYSSVLGELQRNFEKKAEQAVLNGKMSATEAADKYTKEMLDFAKARNKLTTDKTQFWSALLTGNPQKEIIAARKAYQNAEAPESFKNDLIVNQKLSEPRASEIAFPLNKGNETFFKNLPRSKGIFGNQEKVFQEALKRISDSDSIQNFALQLSKKGYSGTSFMDYAEKNKSDLTPMQEREFQNRQNFNPSFSDILYYTLIGKGG